MSRAVEIFFRRVRKSSSKDKSFEQRGRLREGGSDGQTWAETKHAPNFLRRMDVECWWRGKRIR